MSQRDVAMLDNGDPKTYAPYLLYRCGFKSAEQLLMWRMTSIEKVCDKYT